MGVIAAGALGVRVYAALWRSPTRGRKRRAEWVDVAGDTSARSMHMHAPACRCQVQSRSGAALIELITHAVSLRPGVRL